MKRFPTRVASATIAGMVLAGCGGDIRGGGDPPAKNFAFVVDSSPISAYSIDATTGALTRMDGAWATGMTPWSLAVTGAYR